MKAAAEEGDHGMLSVVGLADDKLETCVAAARKTAADARAAAVPTGTEPEPVVLAVANYLFPTGRVVSGDADALEEVQRLATEAGAMKTAKVAVSGAFHTTRMASASEALRTALASVTVSEPRVPTYSNVTGTFFESASGDPRRARETAGVARALGRHAARARGGGQGRDVRARADEADQSHGQTRLAKGGGQVQKRRRRVNKQAFLFLRARRLFLNARQNDKDASGDTETTIRSMRRQRERPHAFFFRAG
jgi:hypothetical protein